MWNPGISQMPLPSYFPRQIAYWGINIKSVKEITHVSCSPSKSFKMCFLSLWECEDPDFHFVAHSHHICLDVQTNLGSVHKGRLMGRGEEESGGSRGNVGKVESPADPPGTHTGNGDAQICGIQSFSWETCRFWRTCVQYMELCSTHTVLWLGKRWRLMEKQITSARLAASEKASWGASHVPTGVSTHVSVLFSGRFDQNSWWAVGRWLYRHSNKHTHTHTYITTKEKDKSKHGKLLVSTFTHVSICRCLYFLDMLKYSKILVHSALKSIHTPQALFLSNYNHKGECTIIVFFCDNVHNIELKGERVQWTPACSQFSIRWVSVENDSKLKIPLFADFSPL